MKPHKCFSHDPRGELLRVSWTSWLTWITRWWNWPSVGVGRVRCCVQAALTGPSAAMN